MAGYVNLQTHRMNQTDKQAEANACPAPSVKHVPQGPIPAFKDTPSQLSMKTLCIETRFWGSNMENWLGSGTTLNS